MALPLVLVAAHVPAQLMLPGIAAFALVLAATTAAFGWFMQAERGGSSITIFDVSGACVLIGIAAGAFSEPNQVFQFFGAAMTAS
jgi:hypothetical protein